MFGEPLGSGRGNVDSDFELDAVGRLKVCAASYRSSAMWAAIDGRRYDDAKMHMREAQANPEMSGGQAIKFRIWSHAGAMYRHMCRTANAFAANDAARNLPITRRDPMFASLGREAPGGCSCTERRRGVHVARPLHQFRNA